MRHLASPRLLRSLASPTALAAAVAAAAAILGTAGPAAADEAEPALAPPGTAPVIVVAPAPAPLPRWTVGLRLGSLSTRAPGDVRPTQFGGGGLEAAYRLWPRWELALELDGGRERNPDGSAGATAIGVGVIAARFHPWPHARWDLGVLAGVGSASIGAADGSGAKVQRPAGALGVSIERHFGAFGLAAELRVLALGAPDPASSDAPPPAQPPTTGAAAASASGTGTTGTGTTATPPADTLSGGSFTLSAVYHF